MSLTTVPILHRDTISELRMAVLILSRRMRYQQGETELSPSESAVLGRIGREGPMTPGVLARAEHVQPPSMTRIAERLEARGLLRRSPHPDDRRQVVLSRTSKADELLARVREERSAWLSVKLAQLSDSDRELIEQAAPALLALAELPDEEYSR